MYTFNKSGRNDINVNQNNINVMQKQNAGHSPFRGRQAFVRLTAQGRYEVAGGEYRGVVVGCSPDIVVVELAVAVVSLYLI